MTRSLGEHASRFPDTRGAPAPQDARAELNSILEAAAATAKLGRYDTEMRKTLIQSMEDQFSGVFAQGTSVVVSLESFEFVSADTRVAALKLFVDTYGAVAQGWAFDVKRPIVIGVHSWPK